MTSLQLRAISGRMYRDGVVFSRCRQDVKKSFSIAMRSFGGVSAMILPSFSVAPGEGLCGDPLIVAKLFLLEGRWAEIAQRRVKLAMIIEADYGTPTGLRSARFFILGMRGLDALFALTALSRRRLGMSFAVAARVTLLAYRKNCRHGWGRLRRTARGRCGLLLLHRGGLSPPTPCRFRRRTGLLEICTTPISA